MILKEFLTTMNFRKVTDEDHYDTDIIRIILSDSDAYSPYFEFGVDDWDNGGKISIIEMALNPTILETEVASFNCNKGYIRVFLEDDEDNEE